MIAAITYHPRDLMEAFVEAHGIDKNDVPLPSTITVEDGMVTFQLVVRDADGKVVFEDGELGDMKLKRVTVQQVVPWPKEMLYG